MNPVFKNRVKHMSREGKKTDGGPRRENCKMGETDLLSSSIRVGSPFHAKGVIRMGATRMSHRDTNITVQRGDRSGAD